MDTFTRSIRKALSLFIFLLMSSVMMAQVTVNISFQVDMTNELGTFSTVHAPGTINGFDPSGALMTDPDGDNIYEVTQTYTGNPGDLIVYKYVKDGSYDFAETVPSECGTGAFSDRFFNLPSSDTTLDVVCFGTCEACITPVTVNVTFQVDMTFEAGTFSSVHAPGTINGFNPEGALMSDPDGDNIFEVTQTYTGVPGELIVYKFVKDSSYDFVENVPAECGTGFFNDRFFNLPESDTTLGVVCFSACEPCGACAPGTIEYTLVIDAASSSFPLEISWELLDGSGALVDSRPCLAYGDSSGVFVDSILLCLNEGESYTFNFFDDFGDGWNGGTWALIKNDCGGVVASGSPDNGLDGDGSACGFGVCCDGSDLEESFIFNTGDDILGCTDPTAPNFNPCATVDDGTCLDNDECADARTATEGANPFSTIGAGGTDITSCTLGDTASVWFVYTLPFDKDSVCFSTCDADFDTGLSIWTACPVDGGVEIACNDDDFGTGGAGVCGGGLQSSICFAATGGATFYIRIAGFNGASGNGNLTIDVFDTPEECAEPTNLTATVMSDKALLDWDDVPGALLYRVKALQEGTTNFRFRQSTVSKQAVMPLSPGTTYFYAIKAFCLEDTSKFSVVDTFTTLLVREGILDESISLYPNPADDQIQLNFNSTTDEDINVSIQDVSGKILRNWQYNVVPGGNTLSLNVEQFANGFYFLRIDQGQTSLVEKFVIER